MGLEDSELRTLDYTDSLGLIRADDDDGDGVTIERGTALDL